MKEIIEILKYRYVLLNFILILLSGVLTFILPVFSVVTFLLVINIYDILGYHFVLIRRTTQLPPKVIIRAYRINQILFEILFLILIGIEFGAIYSIGCLVIKWFGVQDILYYLFLQKSLPDNFTWMKWTPFGIIKGDLSRFEVIFQSVIGIIISILIIIL